MIIWTERATGNHWDAYAGRLRLQVWWHSPGVWCGKVDGAWLVDQYTLDGIKTAALAYARHELLTLIEQCQEALAELPPSMESQDDD